PASLGPPRRDRRVRAAPVHLRSTCRRLYPTAAFDPRCAKPWCVVASPLARRLIGDQSSGGSLGDLLRLPALRVPACRVRVLDRFSRSALATCPINSSKVSRGDSVMKPCCAQ